RSEKVSSPRDSTPVRTAVFTPTSSLIAAGFASAPAGNNFTSLITCVTRASFNGAPHKSIAVDARKRKTAKTLRVINHRRETGCFDSAIKKSSDRDVSLSMQG